MHNADFGKGALAGGALGLLLGKNKTTRKLATYGGLAAIGVMAYKAYGDYKQQQGGAAAEPQTVDRLPPPQVELHSLLPAAEWDRCCTEPDRIALAERTGLRGATLDWLSRPRGQVTASLPVARH